MSQRQSLLKICILFVCLTPALFAATLPEYVQVCHRYDPDLNECVRNTIENLRQRMPNGIPQLHIPPLEPLIIPEVKLDQDSGAVYLHSTYRNIEVRGLSKFEINDIVADVKNNTLDMTLFLPGIDIKADYSLKGKIMMMPLLGDGLCMANLSNVSVVANVCGSRYHKNGEEYLKIDDVKINYNITDTKVRLENLFNGDNALGEKMNVFLNENWRIVSEELRPIMESAMAEVLRQITKKLFEIYTFDQLLPE